MTDAAAVPVVAAVIRRDGRYLLCRRPAEKRHGGPWEFPGGKMRSGETRMDAIRRELTEELGLQTTKLGEPLFSASDEGAPFVIEFVDTMVAGEPVLREHSELGWFTVAEMGVLPLAPADARFVGALQDGVAFTEG